MSITHPRLVAALDDATIGDIGPLVAIGLNAFAHQTAGVYCECDEPDLYGTDLLCGRCLRNNRVQELRRLDDLLVAHEFVPVSDDPTSIRSVMCARCTTRESDLRHHGEDAVGHTSWGEQYAPSSKDPLL